MNIPINSQVSATYARNHFKEINDRAIKEGKCFIVRDSKPVTVVLSIAEYNNLQAPVAKTSVKKMTLRELKKCNYFDGFADISKYQKAFGDISSVELCKRWTDYVD